MFRMEQSGKTKRKIDGWAFKFTVCGSVQYVCQVSHRALIFWKSVEFFSFTISLQKKITMFIT